MQVYIADTDTESVGIMTHVLSQIDGCQVRVFRNGLDAYLWIQSEPPDLLVVDTMTPYLGGLPMVRLLKSHQRFEHVPVLLVSTRATDELQALGRAAGAERVLHKPFDASQFFDCVTALRKASLQSVAAS